VEEKMEEKSKSQIKREMYALQDLGEQLVRLSRGQLEQVELPQELREAVLFAGSLKKYGAHQDNKPSKAARALFHYLQELAEMFRARG
jgi:ribosomal 50S subunit-associated protein YjgA (DUF615 family)